MLYGDPSFGVGTFAYIAPSASGEINFSGLYNEKLSLETRRYE